MLLIASVTFLREHLLYARHFLPGRDYYYIRFTDGEIETEKNLKHHMSPELPT